MRIILYLILFCTSVFSGSSTIAPAFALPDLDNDTITLAQYRGKVVFIDFWVMWCGTCQDEIPKIQGLYNSYKDKGVVFLGIHGGEKDLKKVGNFVKKTGIGYTILNDPEDQIADLYKITGTPMAVIVDSAGTIVKKFREIDNRGEKEIRRILDSLGASP